MVKEIISQVVEKVLNSGKKIVYTEGEDERVLQAAYQIFKKRYARPIVLGRGREIIRLMNKLKIPQKSFHIIDPQNSDSLKSYSKEFYNLRKEKGITEKEAFDLMNKPNYFGVMMVHKNDADCLVGGAVYTTAETLRPALQIVKTRPGCKLASSFFIMVLNDSVYFFADCSIVREPSSEELSEIAISTADSSAKFGLKPRVALLSYSTKGSGSGPSVEKVREAVKIIRAKRPDLVVDGEMQLDAAIVPSVSKRKCKNSPLKGRANVLIFPNLDSGNIGYKLVERLARAKALGPIVQGLNKPINDLSRGCVAEDVFNVSLITILMAQDGESKFYFKSHSHLLGKTR